MRSHLIRSERWQNHNDGLQSVLQNRFGLVAGVNVRLYPFLENALYETAQGTCSFYAHKKSLGLQVGASPLLSHFQKIFLRDGYQVQVIEPSQFAAEPLEAWMQNLKKDTNFCLVQADHPILDQFYCTQFLEEKFAEKKMFCFVLHHQSLQQQLTLQPDALKKINPYSVHVFRFSNESGQDIALALCGERFKAPTLMIDQIDSVVFENQIADLQRDLVSGMSALISDSLKAVVAEKEKQYPHSFQGIENRQYRQLMLGLKNSSDFVYQNLIQKNPKWEKFLFCPHLCWNELMSAQLQWWKGTPDLQAMQNLLVVDVLLLQEQDFWLELEKQNSVMLPQHLEVRV